MARTATETQFLRILVLCSIEPHDRRYGTELVADNLQAIWSEAGHHVVRAGPVSSGMPEAPWFDGRIEIVPLVSVPPKTRAEIFARRSLAVDTLPALLDRVQPDIVVVVGFGPGAIDLAHIEIVKARGVPVVLWHHVPGVTCQQYGLRYKNRAQCDGVVLAQRCAACRLTVTGVPELVAEAASRIRLRGAADALPRGINHLLGARDLSAIWADSVARLRDLLDHVYVGADWVRDVMLRNDFASDKITRVRPGLREELALALSQSVHREASANVLRLSYWGRLDDTKGVDTAIRGVRSIPDANLTFRIAGGAEQNAPYANYLKTLAGDDPRILFVGRLNASQLTDLLSDTDVAVIPSTWLETGPLTIFEAQFAGLPLLGSDFGGVGEVAREDPSARVFPRDDHAALAALMLELLDPEVLAARRLLVPRGRTMRDAAAEMLPAMRALAATRSP